MDANDVNTIDKFKQAKEDLAGVNKTLDERNKLINSEGGGITVSSIKAGDSLANPVAIGGTANGDALTVELRNQEHEPLVRENVTVKDGQFSITLQFVFSSTKEGYVAIYSTGLNGEENNLLEIPVKFGNIEN
jgi:hypothetical protein